MSFNVDNIITGYSLSPALSLLIKVFADISRTPDTECTLTYIYDRAIARYVQSNRKIKSNIPYLNLINITQDRISHQYIDIRNNRAG